MSLSGNELMLSHFFQNVSSMKPDEPGESRFSPLKEKFGIQWMLELERDENDVGVYCHCHPPEQDTPWGIDAEVKLELLSSKGKSSTTDNVSYTYKSTDDAPRGCYELLSWDELVEDYLVDDCIQLLAYIKIKKATGLVKQKLKDFSTPHPNHTDGALIVEGQSFHICKGFLAKMSPVFRQLFFGNNADPNKNEFEVDGVTAEEMQNFLEEVYGKDVINDDTVLGILKAAKLFNWESCIDRCVEFLIEESDKSYKEKLAIAAKYQLEELRDHCIMKLDTKDAIRAALPNDVREMDPTAAQILLQRVLCLE